MINIYILFWKFFYIFDLKIDIALRNLLVTRFDKDGKYLVKVGDFGMARTTEQGIYTSHNARIPIRWAAPEYVRKF